MAALIFLCALLGIAFLIVLVLWLSGARKQASVVAELQVRLSEAEKEKGVLRVRVGDLEQRLTSLQKYQGIVDVEGKVNEMLATARKTSERIVESAKLEYESASTEADQLKALAAKELEQAKLSAKNVKAQGVADANNLKQEALTLLSNADVEAKLIVEKAELKAQEIAGEAYKAMQNASELEKTAKAMKNIIEGYGDRYLIPTYSLLDELADEFGHTDAGEKLKLAREKTRMMIKNGTSATCEYAEANRRETAINFVLDAFNGKVDSILSKVKKDNFGTLDQQIKDAFQVVNNNGKAFRNAVITPAYLAARREELRWAVVALELKAQEQEEQRRIKEQIREEEKARREFEKAIRESQKEEETLKRLIEKAEKEVGLASEEQKAKFEAKLKELEEKLRSAEEKNKRALSMAQQTKSGNVYIISNIGSFGEDVFKIGMTRRLEPLDRVRELGDASVPFEFDVHAMIYSENAPGLERELHKKFLQLQMNKVNPRKEFFKVSLADIRAEVEKLNLGSVKWTMTAEAREYRESLAIAESIANDKQKELEWINSQLQQEQEGFVPEEGDED